MTELWERGAGELATLIREGTTSSCEVLASFLSRVDQVNGSVNAVVEVLEAATVDAKAADAAVASGAPLGPLHGVPFTVKTSIDVQGSATTSGVRALSGAVASLDAPSVERLRKAGAVPMARTNMPDFGFRGHTSSSLYGRTLNPWGADVSAGGSSGGEAAALATGMTPLGLGGDVGGSLRNPAHCCGIAALKPSTGVVPRATSLSPSEVSIAYQLMLADGPMARRVGDLALAFDVIAGPHRRDPLAVPAAFQAPTPGSPIRVAVLADPPGTVPTAPSVVDAITRVGVLLADAGHIVEETSPEGYAEAAEVWTALGVSDVRTLRPQLDPILHDDLREYADRIAAAMPVLDTQGIAALYLTRHALEKRWHEFLTDWDVLVSPACPLPSYPHDADLQSPNPLTGIDMMGPLLPANLLGLPSAVVPCGLIDGLPVGVQLTGRRFSDRTVLALAAIVEDLCGVLTPIDVAWQPNETTQVP